MSGRVVSGWLDGGPGWSPKWIDSTRFVQQLRDVTAFHKDGQAKRVVLDLDSAAVSIGGHMLAGATTYSNRSRTGRPSSCSWHGCSSIERTRRAKPRCRPWADFN